jgi:hypothetical protein
MLTRGRDVGRQVRGGEGACLRDLMPERHHDAGQASVRVRSTLPVGGTVRRPGNDL